jgi:hypothetical protein
MSGLLHRLAERTLNGNGPRVRSVAPVRWLATPEIFEAAELATPAPESAVQPARTARLVATPLPEAPGAALDYPPDAFSPEPAVVTPMDHEKPEAPPAPPSGVEPRQPSAGMPNTPAEQYNPPLVSAMPEGLTAAVAPLSNPVCARHLPIPMLPSPPDEQADPVGARAGLHVPVAAADREPATEVHVHIGRVELTAVAESPPPQRKTQSARTGRSLDEYLQQRKDRRR